MLSVVRFILYLSFDVGRVLHYRCNLLCIKCPCRILWSIRAHLALRGLLSYRILIVSIEIFSFEMRESRDIGGCVQKASCVFIFILNLKSCSTVANCWRTVPFKARHLSKCSIFSEFILGRFCGLS